MNHHEHFQKILPMKQRLRLHIDSIADPDLRKTCETILHYEKFFTWPASLGFHHAYEGGLLAHTVEVCDLCWHSLESHYLNANRDILIASALWHDVMKIEEYEAIHHLSKEPLDCRHLNYDNDGGMATSWISTDYQKTIGHIAGSAAQFQTTAVNFGVNRETIDAVTHCLLAHHGRKEWGSPVEPQTLEALLLHQADMISANYGATKVSLS